MARRPFKERPVLQNLLIESAGAEGNCIARHEGKVVFVKYAVPGDIVDVRVTVDKKNFCEAEIINIIQPSSQRREPHCGHFGLCGGCKWQHMDYSVQLQSKQQWVQDAFERIAKINPLPLLPIMGAPQTEFYRNRLDFTFSNRGWIEDKALVKPDEDYNVLGFHIPGRFDKALDIIKCWHQPDPSNAIRLWVKAYALENGLSFFDLRRQEGFMRGLIIRNTMLGEWMVIVCFAHENKEAREKLMAALLQKFPQLTSLFYVVNTKRNDTIYDQDLVLYHGKPYITEDMDGLKFRIQPKSFFQTNSEQALNLYRKTIEFADLKGHEHLYDLYTGTGTIALYASKYVKHVVGLEYVEQAIADAEVNAEVNSITNATFYAGDIKNLLNDEFIAQNGRPDVIITDPPRAGMHEDVVRKIMEVAPEKVVYVSCNPATQARDVEMMKSLYTVEKLQPVDMFPHTTHVENIALLRLNK